MHRIDTDGHVSNLFDPGDPGVPRLPTQVDYKWANAVQEEIVNVILDAAIALDTTPLKTVRDQLITALKKKFLYGLTTAGKFAAQVLLSVTNTATGEVAIEGSHQPTTSGAAGFGVKANAFTGGTALRARGTGTGNGVDIDVVNGYGLHVLMGGTGAPIWIEPTASPPSVASMGMMYVDSSTGKLLIYDGGAWVPVGSQ